MLTFPLICSRTCYLPIGQMVFPVQKYGLVRSQLVAGGVAAPEDFVEPRPASDADVLLVHTPEYVHQLKTGTLSPSAALQLEVAYPPELVEAYWWCAGGTIQAAQDALRHGVACNIGGGFHHAFPEHGEGFNLINDVAIAIRRLQKDGQIKTAMTVDCDVHHGNGTAAIFGSAARGFSFAPAPYLRHAAAAGDVFTISLHQENNYPAWKPQSSIDVGLRDGTDDAEYLGWLEKALAMGLEAFRPDLICYLAGADPYREDRLGGLDMSIEGLKRRDAMVLTTAKERGIPVLVLPAGGYAEEVMDTVAIHCNTIVTAKEVFAE